MRLSLDRHGKRRAGGVSPLSEVPAAAGFSGGSRPPLARRCGFSLIELLVVIAIISILAALIIGATMRTVAVQAQKNTQTLVQKLYAAIDAQWRATVEQANSETLPPFFQAQLQGGTDPRVVRANYINVRLAQQFPMSYAEALNPDGVGGTIVPADPFYIAKLQNVNFGDPQLVQSGVLLWLMLSSSRGGSTFNQDNLTPREAMAPAQVLPPGTSQGVMCVVDDWKQPLLFQRQLYTTVYLQQAGAALIPFDLPANLYQVPVIGSFGPPPNPTGVPVITNFGQGG